MTKTDGQSIKKRSRLLILSILLLILYILWWIVFVYIPFLQKKHSLNKNISVIKQEIDEKKAMLVESKKAEEFLRSSMLRIKTVRSRLPHLEKLEKFIGHLKKKGMEQNLLVEEAISNPHLLPSPYPGVSLIHPVNLTFRLKGNSISIGKFIQSLDEEDRFFCHIRSLTMESCPTDSSSVLALLKMEVFCQKNEGDWDDVL